jgi:hypothetical protein
MRRIFCVAFLLFAPASVLAQCGTRSVCATSHVARVAVVETPVVATAAAVVIQPVLVPAFSFQYVDALQTLGYGQPAQQQQQQPAAPTPAPAEPAASEDDWPAAHESAASVNTSASQVHLDGNLGGILRRNSCAACHTSPGKAGVVLFDAAGRYAPNVSLERIFLAVSENRMPPAAKANPAKRVTGPDLLAIARAGK